MPAGQCFSYFCPKTKSWFCTQLSPDKHTQTLTDSFILICTHTLNSRYCTCYIL